MKNKSTKNETGKNVSTLMIIVRAVKQLAKQMVCKHQYQWRNNFSFKKGNKRYYNMGLTCCKCGYSKDIKYFDEEE